MVKDVVLDIPSALNFQTENRDVILPSDRTKPVTQRRNIPFLNTDNCLQKGQFCFHG